MILHKDLLHENPANQDILIPLPQGIYTDCVIIRGEYLNATIAIYGYQVDGGKSLPFWKKNIPLELL